MRPPISQEELHKIIRRTTAIRAGATKNVEQRLAQYEYEGYSGKMYYSRTENQNFAENKLFEIRVPPYNVHSRSNAVEEPGFVYVIVGTRVETGGGAESRESWCTLL